MQLEVIKKFSWLKKNQASGRFYDFVSLMESKYLALVLPFSPHCLSQRWEWQISAHSCSRGRATSSPLFPLTLRNTENIW